MPNRIAYTNQELEIAKRAFTALSILDSTKANRDSSKLSHISPAQLYAYASRPNFPIPFEVRHALKSNPRLRQSFHRLLIKCSNYYLPSVAAASSGEITEREAGNFRIRLHPSKVEPKQLYLIIEILVDNISPPRLLILHDENGDYLKQPLPDPHDNQIQLLIQSDSELANAIRKHSSEIFLQ